MNAEVTKDSVCHVAIKVAGYSLAIRATCIQKLCIASKRIGNSMLIVKATLSAIPSAIDTYPATFYRDFLSGDIFRVRGHDRNLAIIQPLTL